MAPHMTASAHEDEDDDYDDDNVDCFHLASINSVQFSCMQQTHTPQWRPSICGVDLARRGAQLDEVCRGRRRRVNSLVDFVVPIVCPLQSPAS